jgi:hypothetical protein
LVYKLLLDPNIPHGFVESLYVIYIYALKYVGSQIKNVCSSLMTLMECHCVLKLHQTEVVFFSHNMFCTKKMIRKICIRGKWNTPRWKEG